MKTILGLLLLIPSITFAGNWISEDDIAKVVAGQHGTTVYMSRSGCSEPCLDITGHDLRRESVQDYAENGVPVRGLRADATLIAFADADDAEKSAALAAKSQAKANVRAADLTNPLTPSQLQAVLKDLIDSQR